MKSKIALVALCLALCGCANERLRSDYTGPDAGTLVFSAESIGHSAAFDFWYKRVGQPAHPSVVGGDGQIENNPGSILNPPLDFTGDESGWVTMQRLKPGEYEVYTYRVYAPGGYQALAVYEPDKDFSYRFTIVAGQTTYIGSFVALLSGKGPVTSVLNRFERDIVIAHQKHPDLPANITSTVAAAPEKGIAVSVPSESSVTVPN